METPTHPTLHAVMFPFFAFGHISPFIQLSNKLSSHNIRISFLSSPGNVDRIKTTLDTSLHHVNIIPLEIPPVDGLPVGAESTADMTPLMAELLKKALDKMQPHVESVLSELKPQFVFHDFAQQWVTAVAARLGIKSIFFSVFSALSSAYCTVPARMKAGESPTLEDMKNPPPGFPSKFQKTLQTFQAEDTLYLFKTFHGNPTVYSRVVTCMNSCTAIAIKTCNQIEKPYIDFVRAQYQKPVLLLGPIIPNPPTGALDSKWANWLDTFQEKSVIFCSFGSETFLKDEEIKELLLGLELTGHPFLVVLNFGSKDGDDRLKRALPKGFENRVKNKGRVQTGWVPQPQILTHNSVGCFVCHAGLSSVIEGLVNECQLVLLPQKGDQFLNAKLVAQDMEIGVEVTREDEEGLFRKEDLCNAVKTVMDAKGNGKTVRENHEKWRNFMMNKHVHEDFVRQFVQDLKQMATK